MQLSKALSKFAKALNPHPVVGGLAITDTGLKLSVTEGAGMATASVRLAPGVVSGGKIQDERTFLQALMKLRGTVVDVRKAQHVVLVLPPSLTYVQSFSIPIVPESQLAEAVRLNLEAVSPFEIHTVYASSERIGEERGQEQSISLLGCFADRKAVDGITALLARANFPVVAVEFPARATVRLMVEQGNLDPAKSYVVVSTTADGLELSVVRNQNLFFSQFHGWAEVAVAAHERSVTLEGFEQFLVPEVQKLLNFVASKWSTVVTDVIILGGDPAKTGSLLESKLSLKPVQVTLQGTPEVHAEWFPAFGAALRGLVPRDLDAFVTLTDEPVDVRYRETRILDFVRLWRRIALTVLGFVLCTFLIAWGFLLRERGRAEEALLASPGTEELSAVMELEERARAFNAAVSSAASARAQAPSWDALLGAIYSLAIPDVMVTDVRGDAKQVAVGGVAPLEAPVIAFKGRLEKHAAFASVVLPLSAIKQNSDGSVSWSATITLKK
jgi:Tfp pilus assembly PilM family ATPase